MKKKLFKKGLARRLFSVVLALVMVVSLIPVSSVRTYAAVETFSFPLVSGGVFAKWDKAQCDNAAGAAERNGKAGDIIEIYGVSVAFDVYVTRSGGNEAWNKVDEYISCATQFIIPANYKVKKITPDKRSDNVPELTIELDHLCPTVTPQTGQAATCTADGWKGYYQCTESTCGRIYANADKSGTAYADLDAWKAAEGKIAKGHDWGYTASGATLTASCSRKATCGQADIALTLSASDTTYTGSAYTGASLGTTTAWTGAGFTTPTIKYVGTGSTTYTESATAPINVGTYTAMISPAGETATAANTAKVNFKIQKQDSPAAPTGLAGVKPSVIGGSDGKITGVTTVMEYSLDNGGTWTDVTGTTITGLSAGVVKVRVKETTTVKAGAAATVTVPAGMDKATGPAAPTGLTGVKPSVIGGSDGKVTGVDATMEYSLDAKTWTPVTGSEITGLRAGDVLVRIKETTTVEAGAVANVTVPAGTDKANGPAAPTGLSGVKPSVIGGSDGKVTGVDPKMEYSLDNGSTWTTVTGTVITGLSAGDVKVRVKETDTVKAGAVATVTVPAGTDKANGPVAPTGLTGVKPSVVGGSDGKVTGVDPKMEYSLDNGGTWTTVSGPEITGLRAGVVKVRVKETATVKAGDAAVVTVPAGTGKATGPAAPTGLTGVKPSLIGGSDGKITGVDATMEYSLDAKNWTTVTGNEITGLSAGDVLVRIKETETVDAGEATNVTVPEGEKATGPAAPTGLTGVKPSEKGASDGKITGVDATMEYSVDGTTWTDVTGTVITDLSAGDVKVRVKETATVKAGAAATVTILDGDEPITPEKQPAKKPTGLTAVKPSEKGASDGKIKGANVTMEYSTDGGKSWKTVTGTEITGLSAGDVLVRVKETETAAASESVKLTIADGDKLNTTEAKPDVSTETKPDASTETKSDTSTETKPATVSKAKIEKNSLVLNKKLKISQTDKKITITWAKVKGADGYNVYATYCGNDNFKKVATTKSTCTKVEIKKFVKKAVQPEKNFKIYIEAYKLSGNKEVVIAKSVITHNVGSKNYKFTNVKSISVSKKTMTVVKGKKAKIVAKTTLVDPTKKQLGDVHVKEFRYVSSDKTVVTVSTNGVIKGIKKGTADVYVYSRNGCAKKIKVTVK